MMAGLDSGAVVVPVVERQWLGVAKRKRTKKLEASVAEAVEVTFGLRGTVSTDTGRATPCSCSKARPSLLSMSVA